MYKYAGFLDDVTKFVLGRPFPGETTAQKVLSPHGKVSPDPTDQALLALKK